MRSLLAFALAAVAAGCGFRGGTPELAGPNEMRPRPGVFSGPSGEFLIVGTRPDPTGASTAEGAAAP